jgi:hypothetical protein
VHPPVDGAPADEPQVSNYVQAIPIFLASDADVSRYFKECHDEIDAITGNHVTILVAKEIAASDAAGVAAVLDQGPAGRFAGLKFGDLPCLWVEDALKQHAVIKLPHEFQNISQTLRTLADVCRKTKDAGAIQKMMTDQLTDDARSRSPLMNALLRELPMSKSSERLIAVICGVVFVSVILVIALFIPTPTPFQYTIFRIVLALAAGGFVSMTPGFIEANVGNVIRGGGALAVFVIVYFYAPAALQALK